jgi:fructose-specific phosphotransferase system component IIB
MIKLANPLYYPVSVLAGGIVLVVGVRLIGLSNVVILPAAAVVTTAGTAILKSREPDPQKLAKHQRQRELQMMQSSGKNLAEKAEILRQEANQLLTTDSSQLELLTAVQYACDRAIDLPAKINQFTGQLQSPNSLLSISELQQQLLEVQTKQRSSSGVARQHLDQLAESLKRNIQLAQQGQDTRTAQITSLYTLIQDAAGVLQQLQNKLRTSDLTNSEQVNELQTLSAELNSFQENVDILVSK